MGCSDCERGDPNRATGFSKRTAREEWCHPLIPVIIGLEMLVNQKLDELAKCAPEASAKSKELVRAAYRYPGGVAQAKTIKDVFEWMMVPSDEARYGTEQFRAGKEGNRLGCVCGSEGCGEGEA